MKKNYNIIFIINVVIRIFQVVAVSSGARSLTTKPLHSHKNGHELTLKTHALFYQVLPGKCPAFLGRVRT